MVCANGVEPIKGLGYNLKPHSSLVVNKNYHFLYAAQTSFALKIPLAFLVGVGGGGEEYICWLDVFSIYILSPQSQSSVTTKIAPNDDVRNKSANECSTWSSNSFNWSFLALFASPALVKIILVIFSISSYLFTSVQ